MIELSANSAITIYLVATVVVLMTFWGYDHYRNRRKQILPSPCTLYLCEFCHCTYLEKEAKPLTQCPQCGSYNKNNVFQPPGESKNS